jgi:PAS domain S-box-containing protein
MTANVQLVPEFLPFLIRMKSFVRDWDGRIQLWNQAAADLYGWTNQEAIGQQCHLLLHTQFPKSVSEIEAELLKVGSWQGELHQTRRDGGEMIILSNWALHYDTEGTPTSVTETNYELTDLKQIQAELKGSQEESYHRLLELEVLYRTAPVGLCFLDYELRYVRLNEALAEINDLSVEAHIGRYASEINPALAKVIVPIMARVLASRQPLLNIEITTTTPADAKRERTWMVNFHPVTNAETFGVSVVFHDITVLKETEDLCTRFSLIVGSSNDAIISMKLDGAITSGNHAAEEMFGYSAPEALGKPISMLATRAIPTSCRAS